MGMPTTLVNNGVESRITKNGQLITAPISYSDPYFKEVSSTAAFNFVKPIAGKRFVVTGAFFFASRSVGTNGTLITVYESRGGPTSTTISKEVLVLDIAKSASATLNGLNFLLSEGVWLNATVDDPTVYITITGYYIDA